MRTKRAQIDLQPVDFGALVPLLELTIGQVAKLSGLSVRQVSYWTNKGILPATNPKKRIYRAAALEKAILLKQCLDQGASLQEAIDLTDAYLRDRAAGQIDAAAAAKAAGQNRLPRPPERVAPFSLGRLTQLRSLAEAIRRDLPLLERRGDRTAFDLAHVKLDVIAFFERNPYARDTAQRIAAQIGRPPELVRLALDDLAQERSGARALGSSASGPAGRSRITQLNGGAR